MNEHFDIIQTASLTEKASLLEREAEQVRLPRRPRANKIQIKQAIEKLFNKKVVAVNTCELRRQEEARTYAPISAASRIGRRPS